MKRGERNRKVIVKENNLHDTKQLTNKNLKQNHPRIVIQNLLEYIKNRKLVYDYSFMIGENTN